MRAPGRLTVTCWGSDEFGTLGTRKVVRRTLRLRDDDGACGYTTTLAFTRLQRTKNPVLQVTVTFPGNRALLPATSPTRTLRLR